MLLHAFFARMRAAGLGASGGQGARSHALVGCGWEVGARGLPPASPGVFPALLEPPRVRQVGLRSALRAETRGASWCGFAPRARRLAMTFMEITQP